MEQCPGHRQLLLHAPAPAAHLLFAALPQTHLRQQFFAPRLPVGGGEPRDAHIRFDIEPFDNGAKSILFARIGFDILSLGWLVKTFLKHHPEIRYGVYPGSALSLLDAVKRSAEER